jgi:hypothetical protein
MNVEDRPLLTSVTRSKALASVLVKVGVIGVMIVGMIGVSAAGVMIAGMLGRGIRSVMAVTTRVFPAHPIRPLGTILEFPNRYARFDLVNQATTRLEGFAAMSRTRCANDGGVTNLEGTDAMQHGESHRRKRSLEFCDNTPHLLDRKFGIRFVLEACHGATVAVIPNGTDKTNDRACARIRDGAFDFSPVEGSRP